jgi:LEA14-like dessication related protein
MTNSWRPDCIAVPKLVRRILVISACAVLLLQLSGCATLPTGTEPPYLSIVSIEPVEVTPLEQKYRFRVRVQNPNDHALDISGMSYVLEINGHSFLKGVSNEAVTIPRFGETVIELSGVSTLFGFVRQIQALQQQDTPHLQYRLSGKLGLAGGFRGLPFSYKGTLLQSTNSADGV